MVRQLIALSSKKKKHNEHCCSSEHCVISRYAINKSNQCSSIIAYLFKKNNIFFTCIARERRKNA